MKMNIERVGEMEKSTFEGTPQEIAEYMNYRDNPEKRFTHHIHVECPQQSNNVADIIQKLFKDTSRS